MSAYNNMNDMGEPRAPKELNSVSKEMRPISTNPTEVESAVHILMEVVSGLSVSIDHLEHKLHPVLHPVDDASPAPLLDQSTLMEMCPLARVLVTENFRIGQLCDRIEHICNLIEV